MATDCRAIPKKRFNLTRRSEVVNELNPGRTALFAALSTAV